MRWGFATWMSDAPIGGNVYDRRLIAELLARDVDLHEHRVDGIWPRVSAVERAELGDLLTREPQWLIDAIVACGARGSDSRGRHRSSDCRPCALLHVR